MSPGETRELADIFHINESPPPVLVEQFCLGELPRTTFKASWESFLFQPEKYSLNFHLFLPTKAHVFLTSHHTQFAPYSTGQCFPPPPSSSTGTKSVTLWRSWKVTVLSGVLELTLSFAEIPSSGASFQSPQISLPERDVIDVDI